jgi:DNA-directed RNA polymerase subunit omega
VARVTIEDCLEKVPNRFALIHFAFQRVKQLRLGALPIVQSKNKEVVVALREIAAGKVNFFLENDFTHIRKEIGIESAKTGERELPS